MAMSNGGSVRRVVCEQRDVDWFESVLLSSFGSSFVQDSSPVAQQREARGWGSLRSHFEKTDMLMDLTAESPGFALRNFTESLHSLFFLAPCENIV